MRVSILEMVLALILGLSVWSTTLVDRTVGLVVSLFGLVVALDVKSVYCIYSIGNIFAVGCYDI